MFISLIFLVIYSKSINALNAFACEGDTLKIKCSGSELISIGDANYGRSVPGEERCPKQGADWNTFCYSKISKNYVTNRCMLKNECSMPALSVLFGDPCKNIYKYLDITYKCLKFKYTCGDRKLRIRCYKGRKIEVMAVHYGSLIPGYLNCSTMQINRNLADRPLNACTGNLPIFFRNMCNGRESCSIPPHSYLFWDTCYMTRKYLIVVYSCDNQGESISKISFMDTLS